MSQKAQQNINNAKVTANMASHLYPWINALQQANTLLPDTLRFSHLQDEGKQEKGKQVKSIDLETIAQLEHLPVFAFTVIVQQDALGKSDLNKVVQTWAQDNPLWQVIAVEDIKANSQTNKVALENNNQPHTLLSVDHITADRLTAIQLYRYILLPTEVATMSAEKKVAAAHILDDTLTAHLKHFITTLPITPDMGGDAAIDCHIISLAQILRPHRIACFDMDSTLIEQEVIVALAKEAGIEEEVSAITERAMRGEIDFDTSFTERMALLAGLQIDLLPTIYGNLSLSAGARTTITALKALGYHTVLLSGGFTYFASKIAELLGIDEVHANVLDEHDGLLTGNVVLPIVNKERKAELVQQIAEQLGVPMSQTLCVGDGANDLAMMAVADLGIAYHAKPIVRARADAAINATGLESVLYILGYDNSVVNMVSA